LKGFVPQLENRFSQPTRLSAISAVVTVSDDGVSGRLVKNSTLPPGDIRNCIVASRKMPTCFPNSSATGSTRDLDSKATVGNLFLAAYLDYQGFCGSGSTVVGDSADAGTYLSGDDLNIELEALLEDGTRVRGETKITASKGRIQSSFCPA
jgi:2-phospho-L-lactate transferase/gluconeogenesis factor (CofD/UPF0052 family)